MARKQKPVANAFGRLVLARLAEKRWSQRDLAARINRGSSYMTYVVHGENPSARSGKFRLQPDVVREIASELGIPLEEAFLAAGFESVPEIATPVREPLALKVEPSAPHKKTKAPPPDQTLFAVAYQAALDAISSHSGQEPPRRRCVTEITLHKTAGLLLTTDEPLSADEIEQVTIGFRRTFEKVIKAKMSSGLPVSISDNAETQ